jgi:hypothetical protein
MHLASSKVKPKRKIGLQSKCFRRVAELRADTDSPWYMDGTIHKRICLQFIHSGPTGYSTVGDLNYGFHKEYGSEDCNEEKDIALKPGGRDAPM